jgi:serine/threonine-protein kinase
MVVVSARETHLARAGHVVHTRRVQVGDYELVKELGRGGMGIVYAARATDGRKVALKLLTQVDAESRARFERERRLLASFTEEEGFVPLLGGGDSPRGAYLVMPLLEGGSLRERLKKGPLAVAEARALGRSLAAALARAHEKGIVHRDVKPENVLFAAPEGAKAGSGPPLLADLGLAKHFRRGGEGGTLDASLSKTNTVAGTLGYMPIEQLEDMRSVGPQADVFALGALLFECLAGELPFGGEGILETARRMKEARRAPLRRLRPDVDPGLAAAVERARELDATKRFRDGGELLRALEARPASRRPVFALTALLLAALAVTGAVIVSTGGAPAPLPPAPAPPLAPPVPARPAPVTKGPSREERRRAALERAARADELGAAGKTEESFALAVEATELDPELARGWFLRAAYFQHRHKNREAIENADKALALDGTLAAGYMLRANAHLELAEDDLALADVDRALALDPRDARGWVIRGRVALNRGDGPGAVAVLTRGLEVAPGEVSLWAQRAYIRLYAGDRQGAWTDAARALEIVPTDATAHGVRGLLLNDQKNPAAIAELTKALEVDEGNVMWWIGRAIARVHAGDKEGARADALRAKELVPRVDEDAGYRWVLARLGEVK